MAAGHGGARRRKHHDDHDEHPSEAWLIALADMMTLLMVTFLMMFAISVVDLKKYEVFSKAFAESLGKNLPSLSELPTPKELKPENTEDGVSGVTTTEPFLNRDELAKLKIQVQAALTKADIDTEVQVSLESRGLVLYVTSGVLFRSGDAALTAQGRELLTRLSPVFRSMGNSLIVEGHTDSDPIRSSQYPSNWELSTSRATSVVQHLLASGGVPATRLSAAGYADTKPRKPNTTDAGKATNRRVEIVVLPRPGQAIPGEKAAPAPSSAATPAADSHGAETAKKEPAESHTEEGGH